MKVHDWKPYEKNTLRGFFTLEFRNGLCIKECTLHEKAGQQWISFPGIPFTKDDGSTGYKNVILFEDKSRMEALKTAVLPLLAEVRGPPPAPTGGLEPDDAIPF